MARFESNAWWALVLTLFVAQELCKRFEEMSIALIGNCPLEFSATIKAELPKWAGLTRAAGIKIDPP